MSGETWRTARKKRSEPLGCVSALLSADLHSCFLSESMTGDVITMPFCLSSFSKRSWATSAFLSAMSQQRANSLSASWRPRTSRKWMLVDYLVMFISQVSLFFYFLSFVVSLKQSNICLLLLGLIHSQCKHINIAMNTSSGGYFQCRVNACHMWYTSIDSYLITHVVVLHQKILCYPLCYASTHHGVRVCVYLR